MNWLPVEESLSFQAFFRHSAQMEDLKYEFNASGELRHIETQGPYVFNYYKNALERNSRRHRALGRLLERYVYALLERVCRLKRVYIPTDASAREPRSCFFMSEEAPTNPTLLVLLQDRGILRAGQWGQRTVIHDGLRHGTQITCIRMAFHWHWDVVVLNPNDNFSDLKLEEERDGLPAPPGPSSPSGVPGAGTPDGSRCLPKRCSGTPEEHTTYIWDHFISKSAARDVAFVCHGYGGLVFVELLSRRRGEVMGKVFAVALVDSGHHVGHQLGRDELLSAWIKQHCREWVTSPKRLDKPAGSVLKADCPTVSAGTEKPGLALSCSLRSIFKFFKTALKAKTVVFSRAPIVTRSSTKRKL
ncbi:putative protein FAM172B [Ornithorhynchus anatinus]|uniref:putative protein FAM172B n=1 Tax=Ornithorhynchus anatinus TaxID=9258 RepID=UPI0010A886E7|nr:putative protein FAM172B [Ornithorhynchus anatinus]XP_016081086.2 putative protein FAM172B [Ornithorhynchus anatinus]